LKRNTGAELEQRFLVLTKPNCTFPIDETSQLWTKGIRNILRIRFSLRPCLSLLCHAMPANLLSLLQLCEEMRSRSIDKHDKHAEFRCFILYQLIGFGQIRTFFSLRCVKCMEDNRACRKCRYPNLLSRTINGEALSLYCPRGN
jgi:hypothetical protein